MPHFSNKNYFLWKITILIFITVGLIAILGVVLEVIGSRGYVEFDFSIKKFISTNTGIAALCICAILLLIIIPIIIGSFKQGSNHGLDHKYIQDITSYEEPSQGRPGEWPPNISNKILELLKESEISSSDIAYALGISEKMADNILDNMIKKGSVTKIGNIIRISK